MSLPAHNPIDNEWLTRGTPIDHLGTLQRFCEACQKRTNQECYHVIVGSTLGFGAPYFVKPFLKRSTTKAKIGGTRGNIAQCTNCDSLWALDTSGSDVFLKLGLNPKGEIHPSIAIEANNRIAVKKEADLSRSLHPQPESRVSKKRD